MPERPDFQRRQQAFAAHIRDPQAVPLPDGIDERRMAVYRNLFFNNLRSLLGTMFPVLKKIHAAARWDALVRAFMKQHRAQTPYFLQLPAEFLAFLREEFVPQADDYPFLAELAHYEYAELALSISEAVNDAGEVNPDGDLLAGIPAKSRLAWVFSYRFPVHRIAPDFLPAAAAADPLHLAIYRRADDSIGFLELNAVSARLVHEIEHNDADRSGEQILHALAGEIGYTDVDAFVRHGGSTLRQLRERDILVGTRKT